ncbi:hypothetical protein LCGC14_2191550 [marine sediment metagenome]|uniref:Uncharacterized protein n=1 Tax=marine sediment metagenome TaxID=412755 RepID=A0A0F9E6I6_9ZZZZ
MDENIHMTKPDDQSFMIFDPDWLVKIEETDDSEYRYQPMPESALAPGDYLFTEELESDFMASQWIPFALGVLASSVVWFAILLWLLRL